jgi:hypothetical protein
MYKFLSLATQKFQQAYFKNKKAQVFTCAQIVPAKVKSFKKFPNRSKNAKISYRQINQLEIHEILKLLNLG